MQSIGSSVLQHTGYVALPEHRASGGFDHAAVHAASGHVYVAHTANDAVDVFDPVAQIHLYSIPQLPGVAGVVVSDEAQLIISSNRAENTIGIFPPGPDPQVSKIAVGVRPNGLAYDPVHRQILVANVGDPAVPGSHTLTIVAIDEAAARAEIAVAGRTRWAIFDPEAQVFYVNIADPAEIVVVDARRPRNIASTFAIPSVGPHGLDLDPESRRLFCACDSGELITLDARSGKVLGQNPLSGSPDVVFFDRVHERLYVAAGEPGTIDVFDTKTMGKLGTVATELGAHTFALAPTGGQIYVFLPRSHRAAIYQAAHT
ncbi:MAG TPA: YncE family protein [Xanthobacteraceae bacterium]|nr:YncE family protein [Xanthobacteraceae bacterium]